MLDIKIGPHEWVGKRVLCVCQKGNSRSVALAWLLKKKYHADALACGVDAQAVGTVRLLCEWVEIVILTAGRYQNYLLLIAPECESKLLVWDVGHEKWFKGFSDDLIQRYFKFIRSLA